MQDITWVGVVGVLLLASTLLSIYNSAKAARKNADEPLREIRTSVNDMKNSVSKLEFRMERAEKDLNHAHEKIRENEATANNISKAQNKALLAILLWIKDPQSADKHQIDEAIKEIGVS